MKTSTKQDILQYIKLHDAITVKELLLKFPINATMMHRHLNDLIEIWSVYKIGTTPKVFYIAEKKSSLSSFDDKLDYQQIEFLDNNYYNYDSDGNLLSWYQWFVSWCADRWLDIEKQYTLYKSIIQHIQWLKDKNGIIDGKKSLSDKLWNIYIDELGYIDAYQIGHFGRSKLWSITFYAKQSQNQDLINQVVDIIKIPIQKYIKQNHIDAVCFVPPSIYRQKQLMTEIKRWLSIQLPEIKFQKLFPNNVIIPQKSLKSMDQRIKNATNTLFILNNQSSYKNILIIDDFMGSWATINITAMKIKQYNIAKKTFAISLLGNIDTKYEVINEI